MVLIPHAWLMRYVTSKTLAMWFGSKMSCVVLTHKCKAKNYCADRIWRFTPSFSLLLFHFDYTETRSHGLLANCPPRVTCWKWDRTLPCSSPFHHRMILRFVAARSWCGPDGRHNIIIFFNLMLS